MTFVAGFYSPDGVLVGADCRLTVTDPSGHSFPVDNAMKIARLGVANALGYAGDLHTIALLLGQLLGPQLAQRRTDAVSVSRWLPRFLRATYAAIARRERVGHVAFVVAGTVPGRPVRLPWADFVEWLDRTPRGVNCYLALRYLNGFPRDGEWLEVPGSSEGLLYSLESPQFQPHFTPPLGAVAIGSGDRQALAALERYRTLLIIDHPNRIPMWFADALSGVLGETDIASVGGMLLIADLFGGVVKADCLSQRTGKIGLAVRGSRFVVRDRAGVETVLRGPGELLRMPPRRPLSFDDFRVAQLRDVDRRRSLDKLINQRSN